MSALPAAFTLADARAAGLRKDQVYQGVEAGEFERVGRGVYVAVGSLDPSLESLAAATAVQPSATMCLTSALVRHDLSDEIPIGTDIALPRGVRHPAGFDHVTWHSFDPTTFQIGREALDENFGLFTYSPERTVVDVFRLVHQQGSDTAITALKRWLHQPGHHPSALLSMAASFPKVHSSIGSVLEVLT
ncbi:type IV toxin-antitoxin system AbiEi family antitoxin domain-containing protein [Propionimicrobium sp. PCR01-08-3]|uniref:type IV toxin-antitoxin system AbiEi family antitoxin domain-containing protein n=1 Tax=Propionimicrobium sp. PCR01-08-3 TaxID=3052086 RepID=UPI00255C2CC0|nr:type IV toxin-antitoxin system AbiEi family antitoxin domain-containing protein [Propionimicrobium sp. PCR01-08-3]WIY83404.1 type IV toxin-antitoxin system AbiEi family antitoxin domain-containing protein [Propionimicrobium sp. PCR01-08-3]